jgi:pyruvate kinase
MVTLPTEAAYRYDLLKALLERGTDCIRINCAHDRPQEWEAMIQHLRLAEKETGYQCKVMMDLAGPKIRTTSVLYPSNAQRLHQGDILLLSVREPSLPQPDYFQAGCSHPEIFSQLSLGETLWIDDGHIGAVVEKIAQEGVWLRITHARPKGEKLRPEKGLNFPYTALELEPLTESDRTCLDFVVQHADILGYSFVQKARDIEMLQLYQILL